MPPLVPPRPRVSRLRMRRLPDDGPAGPPAPERPPHHLPDGSRSPARHWSLSPTSRRGLNS
eukprot:2640281-Alexandrium_andersonii.AAC.1